MAIKSLKRPSAPVKASTKRVADAPAARKARTAQPVKKGPFGRPLVAGAKSTRSAAPRRKPIKFVFKAPAGLSGCFIDFGFSTAKDGFIAPGCTVEIIKGKWDNENAPRYDMMEHDPQTALALIARFNMLMYAANPAKRLPPKQEYQVLIRVSVLRRDNSIRAGIKACWHTNPKRPDADLIEFVDKKDPEYRRIRRTGKFLAGSLTSIISLDELKEIERERVREEREAEKEQARLDKIEAREAAKAAKAEGRAPRGGRAPAAAKARARR